MVSRGEGGGLLKDGERKLDWLKGAAASVGQEGRPICAIRFSFPLSPSPLLI